MKAGWEIKRLEELGTIQTGSTPKTSEKLNFGDFIPFIKPGDFTSDGSLIYGNEGLSELGLGEARRVVAGSVMMVCIGATIGKCGFSVHDVTMNQQINSLTPGLGVSSKFVYYQMLTEDFQRRVILNSAQMTLPIINKSKWSALTIAIPPLPEQQRIVRILDEAFDGIATVKANAEKNLQNARELFESYLEAVFSQRGEGWVESEKPLADLCELIVDCEHNTAPTLEEGIPSIRTTNVGKGKLLLNGVYRVSEETYRKWTRRAEPRAGDLILAREAPAGNIAVIPQGMQVCLGQRTVLIRPNKEMFEPQFLCLLILQPEMQRKLLAKSRGATVQHVNMKDIRALNVGAVPLLSEQRNIITKVNNISTENGGLISIYVRKLAALDELKKSLLQQAFNGEL